jgi:aminopeptidase N
LSAVLGKDGKKADKRDSVPNLPFFYLCFRAYSHYRALYGGKMLSHLMGKNLVKETPSPTLDAMYATGLLHPTRQASRDADTPSEEEIERVSKVVAEQTAGDAEEVMVLQKWNGKLLAEAFELPEMEVEIERAVEQVEKAIKSDAKLREEKREVERKGGEDKKDS